MARPFRLDEEQVLHFAVRSVLLLDRTAAVNERVKASESSASERDQACLTRTLGALLLSMTKQERANLD